MTTYTSMIVGTDGSETAERAVRHAAQLAAKANARLVIVTAFEPHGDKLAGEVDGAPDELRWMLTDRSQAEERARKGRQLASAEGVTGAVVQALEGDPAEVLLGAAEDFNADLIVVGSKGLTGASRFVLGSVASSVSHHAPCDVLIVHTTS
jgi:nucleotide-binding universal stress UspA family protein